MHTHRTGWSPWPRVQTQNYFWKSQKKITSMKEKLRNKTLSSIEDIRWALWPTEIFVTSLIIQRWRNLWQTVILLGYQTIHHCFCIRLEWILCFAATIYGKAKRSLLLVKIATLRQTVTGHRSPTHRLLWGLNWNEKWQRNCEFLNVSSIEVWTFFNQLTISFPLIF